MAIGRMQNPVLNQPIVDWYQKRYHNRIPPYAESKKWLDVAFIGGVYADSPPNLTVTLFGTGAVGDPLTAFVTGLGQPSATLTYQWLRNGANINGQLSASYTPVAGDLNTAISCRVTGTNALGTDVEVAAPITIAIPAAQLTSVPALTGTGKIGSDLSLSTGTWSTPPNAFQRRYLRNGVIIAGQSLATYTVIEADDTATITGEVRASTDGGINWSAWYSSSGIVATFNAPVAINPAFVYKPGIGTQFVPFNALFTVANDADSSGLTLAGTPPTLVIINNTLKRLEISTTEVFTMADLNFTATNSGGSVPGIMSLTVNNVAPVNTVQPVLSGTGKIASSLSLSTGTWVPTPTTYERRYKRNGTVISGQTAATYLIPEADDGTTITGEVRVSDDSGTTWSAWQAASGSIPVTYLAPTALNPSVIYDEDTGVQIVPFTTLFSVADDADNSGLTVSGTGLPAWVTVNNTLKRVEIDTNAAP